MPGHRELRELVSLWHRERAQGKSVDVGSLCAQRPELRPALAEEIETILSFERQFGLCLTTGGVSGASAMTIGNGVKLPGYEVLGILGRGGMGIVYKARSLKAQKLVALKMMLAGSEASNEQVQRFLREAKAIALLRHPNIVQILAHADRPQQPYFVLEYVDGGSLADQLTGKPQPLRWAAEMVAKIARAVHFAHERGIVHRDLKPSNVLLTEDGVPKVTDFGLAKQLCSTMHLTQSGAILGTPAYMAPEQAAGKTGDASRETDIYALGTMLYELITGRLPFEGDTAIDLMLQIVSEAPQSPRRLQEHIPPALERICLDCLEKEPGQRYATASALADDLQRWRRGRAAGSASPRVSKERSLPLRPILCGAAAVGVIVLVLVGAAVLCWKLVGTRAATSSTAARASDQGQQANAVGTTHPSGDSAKDLRPPNGTPPSETPAQPFEKREPAPEPAESKPRAPPLPPPQPQQLTEVWRIQGNTARIWCVAFSPDGTLILSTGDDGYVRVWTRDTGKLLHELKGHRGPCESAVFTQDNERIVSGGSDGTLRIWNVRTEQELANLRHPGSVPGVAVSPDGTLFISTCTDGNVRIGVMASGTLVRTLRGHKGLVAPVAFSPTGKEAITAGGDGIVCLWDLTRAVEKKTFAITPKQTIRCLAFSTDGTRIAAGDLAGFLRIWDVENGKELVSVRQHTEGMWGVAFSPDGRRVLTGSTDQTMRVSEADTGRQLSVVRGIAQEFTRIAYSPDGRHALSGGADKMVRLWELSP